MKVVCKLNNIFELKKTFIINRLKQYINLPDGELNLQKGNEYCVYGIIFWDNSPWYYICIDEEDDPSPYPAELFEIVDKRMSKYWQLSFRSSPNYSHAEFVFPEWAEDPLFYEYFVDGDPSKIPIFKKYRQLMDEEFELS